MSAVPVSKSSTPSVLFASAMPVFESSTPSIPSVSSIISTPAVLVSKSFTLSASSVPFVPIMPMSGSSALFVPSAPFVSFPHIPTSRRQKLIELNGRKIRETSKEFAPVFTRQLFSNLLPFSPFFFLSCYISEKRSFDKAFNFNSWPLAKDYTRKEIDLGFAVCHCPAALKTNKE